MQVLLLQCVTLQMSNRSEALAMQCKMNDIANTMLHGPAIITHLYFRLTECGDNMQSNMYAGAAGSPEGWELRVALGHKYPDPCM